MKYNNLVKGSVFMAYESKNIRVNNISPAMSIHDKNDFLFKNRLLNKNYDLPQKKRFKDDLEEERRKKEEKKESVKDSIEISSQDEKRKRYIDSIDIDFLNAIKNNQKTMEQQYIACKIACGEYTSKDEINYLKSANMDLLKRAIAIGNQRRNLEMKLKMAKNNHEAAKLIFRFRDMINKTCLTFDNKALDGGTIKVIMRCAIDKVEKKYLNNDLYDDNLELQINLIELGVL